MRIRAVLCFAFVIATVQSPRLLHAQFQPPTNEDLQMTEDPKAPGAAAVYLYREETTDDTLHYNSYFERIKVLTEKGKELATVRISYERNNCKVTNIQGRTIHSDGTIIPLIARPSDLTDEKTAGHQINTVVFTLPSVEVGSILEYRLNLSYDDGLVSSPHWTVQQPYFVHKAHYSFTPMSTGGRYITNSRGDNLSRLMYSLHAGNGSKVVEDTRGRHHDPEGPEPLDDGSLRRERGRAERSSPIADHGPGALDGRKSSAAWPGGLPARPRHLQRGRARSRSGLFCAGLR